MAWHEASYTYILLVTREGRKEEEKEESWSKGKERRANIGVQWALPLIGAKAGTSSATQYSRWSNYGVSVFENHTVN